MPLTQKTLPINLTKVFSPTRPRRKPPVPRRHLQPTNRRAITRRNRHGLQNRIARQLGKRQVLRLQGFQLLLVLSGSGEVFTAVHRRAVFSRQLGIILTRQLASLGANLRCQQAQNNAVFVSAPRLTIKRQKTRASAFFAAEHQFACVQAFHKPFEAYGHFIQLPALPGDHAVDHGRRHQALVSSSMIDRVVAGQGRELYEVPVGFKWFVEGLHTGELVFGGEESAGASFLTFDGKPWSTDKDGIILCLLAAEIRAKTGKLPSEYYAELTAKYSAPVYRRKDFPATAEQKQKLKTLKPEDLPFTELAGNPIVEAMTTAPGNGAAIGGLKVTTRNGWFAARPSGTEDLCKIYGESFVGAEHLSQIFVQAETLLR